MEKEKQIEQLLDYLHKNNANTFEGDCLADALMEKKDFAIVCLKCGSTDIDVIGEEGKDYGGQTGYAPGAQVIKCNGCGNAVEWWQ